MSKKSRLILLYFTLIVTFFCSNFQIPVHSFYYIGDKPLFVEISTQWCFACKMLKPTIEELKTKYGNQIEFVTLDATSEETTKQAEQIASDYGILDYFKNNRNAFPRVSIFCTNTTLPEKTFLGAQSREVYEGTLDELSSNGNGICNLPTKPNTADLIPNRPEEPKITEITGDRPQEPIPPPRPDTVAFLDRPQEILSSGRPPELSFWTVGQQIPYFAYFQYLVLPKCSGENNIVCSNFTDIEKAPTDTKKPAFKPWTPNATRNEKGLHLLKI